VTDLGKKRRQPKKSRDELQEEKGIVEVEATVIEPRGGLYFLVELDNGHEALCTLSGRVRKNRTIVPGDRVKVELSAYDLTRGRITWRLRDMPAPKD